MSASFLLLRFSSKMLHILPSSLPSTSHSSSSSFSTTILKRYGHSFVGTLAGRLLARNGKARQLFVERFSAHFLAAGRGAKQSVRLLGISLGILWPNLIRIAKCQVNTTSRTRPFQSAQSRLSEPSVSWAEFWALIRPYFGWILFAAAAAAIVALLNIQIPILLGQLVNQIASFLTQNHPTGQAAQLDLPALRPVASKLVAAYFGQAFATFLCITSLSWMGERMSANLRVQLFSHLLNFPMPFFDAQRSSELSDRLNFDVQEFKSSFKNCTVQGLRTLAQVLPGQVPSSSMPMPPPTPPFPTVGCVLSLYLMNPRMTLLTVGILPVVVVFGALFGKLLRRMSLMAQAQGGVAAGVAGEAFQNVRTVKMFAMEEAESSLYQAEVQKARALNERLGLGIGLFQAVSNLFLNGLVLAVLYGGGQMVAAEALSPGELMSFLATAQTIQRSLAQLSLVFDNWVKTWSSCARIMEFLRFEPSYGRGGTRTIPWHSLTGQIQLNDIHFTYPTRPGHEVLRGLDMHIGAGQTVAICGPSGAGKSTIGALIGRLYEPQSGEVTLDGLNLREMDAKWLRQTAIGAISQEPVLFSTSIRENIRYGRADASDKEIREAAELANASQFIEQFPEGYETLVGERGLALSGGQKQRIAIARALLKNPPILLLDEATSALDTESERLVQQALGRVMRDRTVVIIAHRLSTIRNADKIYVLNDGRVEEEGTHNQLIRNRHGLYRRLVQEQQETTGTEGA